MNEDSERKTLRREFAATSRMERNLQVQNATINFMTSHGFTRTGSDRNVDYFTKDLGEKLHTVALAVQPELPRDAVRGYLEDYIVFDNGEQHCIEQTVLITLGKMDKKHAEEVLEFYGTDPSRKRLQDFFWCGDYTHFDVVDMIDEVKSVEDAVDELQTRLELAAKEFVVQTDRFPHLKPPQE